MPVQWARQGEEMGRRVRHSHWHEEMGWEAKLLGLRISCMLYCFAVCIFPLSMVPLKGICPFMLTVLSAVGLSSCFYCFVSSGNSLRAGSPLSNSTYSMKTLLRSVSVACTIQRHKILVGLRVLPQSRI